MFEQIFARKDLEGLRISNARDVSGEWNAVTFRDRSHHIVISDEAQFDERFAE